MNAVTLFGSIGAVAVMLAAAPQATAFNPQPEPPGSWSIEGFIDLTASQYEESSPGSMPFGLTADILNQGQQPAFTIALRGVFAADGDVQPVPGRHDGILRTFDLEIGNAKWTAANVAGLAFELMPGNPHVYVTGMTADPGHQSLALFLPSSPGRWDAIDVVNGDVRGRIGGTYVLRDGVIPEPTTFSLVALSQAGFGLWRRSSFQGLSAESRGK
jgi:hypothetical protein